VGIFFDIQGHFTFSLFLIKEIFIIHFIFLPLYAFFGMHKKLADKKALLLTRPIGNLKKYSRSRISRYHAAA
jgi:hypothetical protein